MANNIRAISTGYKVNTEEWKINGSELGNIGYVQIPTSVIGRNIVYGFSYYQNYSDPYYSMLCFEGTWYICPGWAKFGNLTYDSSSGILNGGSYWITGYCKCLKSFIVYT